MLMETDSGGKGQAFLGGDPDKQMPSAPGGEVPGGSVALETCL